MSDYDRRAWDAVVDARQRALMRSPRRLIPSGVRNRVSTAGADALRHMKALPGADDAERAAKAVLDGGAQGLARAANASLGTERVLAKFQAAGHPVVRVGDIRGLDLTTVDEAKPTLDARYVLAGAASGVTAGMAISRGELAALGGAVVGGAAGGAAGAGVGAAPGAGAGAAPGAAVVLGAMAADAAAVVLASMRAIFQTAQYYGYDTNQPDERLRALGVLNLATAADAGAKQAAYRELDKLVNLIVRNATWKQLDENVIGRVLHKVLQQQATRVTKRKFANAVPLAGIAIGAGFNMRMLSRVTDTAELHYRERFLREKYDIPAEVAHAPTDSDAVTDIPLADVVEEEIEQQSETEPPSSDASGADGEKS